MPFRRPGAGKMLKTTATTSKTSTATGPTSPLSILLRRMYVDRSKRCYASQCLHLKAGSVAATLVYHAPNLIAPMQQIHGDLCEQSRCWVGITDIQGSTESITTTINGKSIYGTNGPWVGSDGSRAIGNYNEGNWFTGRWDSNCESSAAQ